MTAPEIKLLDDDGHVKSELQKIKRLEFYQKFLKAQKMMHLK